MPFRPPNLARAALHASNASSCAILLSSLVSSIFIITVVSIHEIFLLILSSWNTSLIRLVTSFLSRKPVWSVSQRAKANPKALFSTACLSLANIQIMDYKICQEWTNYNILNSRFKQMETQYFKGEITVTVEAPELRSEMGGASKHHTYRIHGADQLSDFEVHRRYSDFVILKQMMAARWPGVYVPALPEKKFLGNNESAFLEVRKQGLEDFLRLIAEQPYLWYGDEFQLFIKSKSPDVEKFLNNLGKTNNKQIATKYRIKFPTVLESVHRQDPEEYNMKIGQFRAYLKSALIVLEKVNKVADLMTQARKRFNERYESLLTNILPNYEQSCISEYTENKENLWFAAYKNNGILESSTNLFKNGNRNPFAIMNQFIKQQMRELLNFQQILKNKQEYQGMKLKCMSRTKDLEIEETKINAGKESIFNKIKNASKQQQLQENRRELQKSKQQLKDAEQICKCIEMLLVNSQISKFKAIRQRNYYKIVKDMAKAEKEMYELEEELWGRIAGEPLATTVDKPQTGKETDADEGTYKLSEVENEPVGQIYMPVIATGQAQEQVKAVTAEQKESESEGEPSDDSEIEHKQQHEQQQEGQNQAHEEQQAEPTTEHHDD